MELMRSKKFGYIFFISTLLSLLVLTLITIKVVADPSIEFFASQASLVTSVPDRIQSQIGPNNLSSSSQTLITSTAEVVVPPATEYGIKLTETPTPTSSLAAASSISLLPIINIVHDIPVITPSPIEKKIYCDTLEQPLYIPDNNIDGVNNYISINEDQLLVNLELYLDVSHSAVGDLVIKLTNPNTTKMVRVMIQPGGQNNRCMENDVVAILDDGAAQFVDEQCAPESPAISGIYRPSQYLNSFTGIILSGEWRLNISDRESGNTGSLNHWCMVAELTNLLPSPTPPPTPVNLPEEAFITGMSGQGQYFNLDCESRSAVDWAKHFDVYIDELDFYYNLPQSDDDPEVGFVGDPSGQWGQIPPDDYGVHASPIADLLRDYGLNATAYRSLTWDDVRAEIANGNPVIVWIIGDYFHNLVNGIPHLYTPPSTGNSTIVAPFEHTVVVVGYTPDTVTVLNGSYFITLSLDQFLDSWSVLQFMGVVASP